MKKTKVILVVLTLAIAVISTLVLTTTAVTIRVPNDYSVVQDAIDAAQDGDTVYINNGDYPEDIFINKDITLTGKERAKVIISRVQAVDCVVTIEQITTDQIELSECPNSVIDDVSVYEMAIEQSPGTGITNSYFVAYEVGEADGLIITDSVDCVVRNNEFSNFWVGIHITDSDDTIIDNNIINGCTFYGIEQECKLEITDNVFSLCGIAAYEFAGSTLSGNTIDGLDILYYDNIVDLEVIDVTLGQLIVIECDNALIQHVVVETNTDGIVMFDSEECTITQCELNNSVRGIFLVNVDNSDITYNTIRNSSDNAMEGRGCDLNTVSNNEIIDCVGGICIY